MSLMGTVLSVSSESWFTLWVGVEISSLFFTPLVSSYSFAGFPSWVKGWKYLITQFVGSTLLFFSVVLLSDYISYSTFEFLFILGVSVKIGLFPLHGWMFHIFENSDYLIIFLLSSIQKVAPLVAIFRMGGESMMFLAMFLFNGMWASILSIHMYSMSFVLCLSSMLFTSWICLSSISSWGDMVWFFFVYSFHLGFFLYMLNTESKFYGSFSSFFEEKHFFGWEKFIVLMSLAGMPPFMVFWMKMEIVSNLIWSSMNIFPCFIIVLCSAVMIFGYLKFAIPLILKPLSLVISVGKMNTLMSLFVFMVLFFLPICTCFVL